LIAKGEISCPKKLHFLGQEKSVEIDWGNIEREYHELRCDIDREAGIDWSVGINAITKDTFT
jgi:hypothetical protein